MSENTGVFVPVTPYDDAAQEGPFGRFEPSTRTLPAGFRIDEAHLPLPQDLVFEKDTAVQLRDGTTIYTDVFRPVGEGSFPAIIAWSPYGKNTGNRARWATLRTLVGVDESRLSGLMKWEGPDPAFWCTHGYAVCHPDARGAFKSEGDIQFFGTQEGRDTHDFIEWVAAQPWCSGKVGMAGNSWLAVSQWFAAAEQPPHLAAIAPWEGHTDIYRDSLAPGGIPDPGFQRFIISEFVGQNRAENPSDSLERYPLYNDYWATKTVRFDRITVPAYVAASYTNTLHTPGTFRAWRNIASTQKWLRIHNRIEWNDFYDEKYEQDLLRFFDHFLKDADNGWDDTPSVRYSLLDLEGGDVVDRPAPYFPPPAVVNTPFYLDTSSSSLTSSSPATEETAGYDAEHGRLEFHLAFDEATEIVGYPKITLWVEAEGHDEMDLFVFLQKLDRDDNHLTVQTSGADHPQVEELTRENGSILKHKAVPGRLRVSLRRLDPDQSTSDVPVHSFDTVEKLEPGQIVPVEIPLLPVGLQMDAGESLRLIVTGQNLIGTPMPFAQPTKPDNHGRHIIHVGGQHNSHVVLPVLGGDA